MELRHLEHFVAVAEEQHFTRAAERLLVSQSGLSASIRALEQELKAPLFVRTTRRVTLTQAGRALLTEAVRTLAAARAARDAVAATQGLLSGTLTVGTEQCVAGVQVAALLAAFRARHPGVEIRLRQHGSARLLDEVAAGRLDLAFAVACGPAPARVRLLPLAGESMVVLCHTDHRLARSGRATWQLLQDETFVDFHPDWGPRRITDRAFAAAGVVRRVPLEVSDVHSLLELLHEGLGIALVPEHFARKPQAAGLTAVPPAPLPGASPLRYESSAAVPPHADTSPAARALLALLPRSPSLGQDEEP